ncbi:hypothetical protein [Actinosynnema sp. NPDC020468]|uniref:hypothetical protein n=1 Tax=Actinosynnema sp. NPDC020468 TaxID=3154488 RepID=UPI0033C59FFC
MAPSGSGVDPAGISLMQTGVGADKIYGWFHDGDGPENTTDHAQHQWKAFADGHTAMSQLIDKAVRESGTSWEGTAGDQARASTSPLASWSQVVSQAADVASKGTGHLGEAFRLARNSVEKPVEVPDKPWYNDALPWDTDYDEAVEKSQEVDNRNLQVLNTYGGTAMDVASAMPTFPVPADIGANVEEPKPIIEHPVHPREKPPRPRGKGHGEVGEEHGEVEGKVEGHNGGDDRPIGITEPSWVVPPPPGPGDTGRDIPGPTDGDTRKSWTPGQITPPGVTPPGDPTTRPGTPGGPGGGLPYDPRLPYNPNNPNDPRNPNNRGTPRVPGVPGGPGGGRAGTGGLGGRVPGAGGTPGVPGGPGTGGLASGGTTGALTERGGGFGPGGQGGFGPAGSGARGAGAGAGMGGMGGAGAPNGEGDEDKEHRSASYLQETEDIFGDGAMVAPPVIGE